MSNLEKYEKQANVAILLSILAYADFSMFREKGTDRYVINGLKSYLKDQEYEKTKSSDKSSFLNTKSLKTPIDVATLAQNIPERFYYSGIDNRENICFGLRIIKDHIDEYNDCKILNISSYSKGYNQATLEAITVEMGSELYIVYRGTGAGKWIDNGQGLYSSSEMQFEAARYFQEMAEKYGKDKKIYLAGHSKGGNLAQAALMNSKAGERVEKVFSFDGQGFSKQSVEHFKSRADSKRSFEALTNKIYSICASDDFVNPLGVSIVPEKNTVFIRDVLDEMPHDPAELIYKGKLDFKKEGERIVSCERGPIGKFVKALNDKLMKKDERTVGLVSLGGMNFANKAMAMRYKDKHFKEAKYGSGTIKGTNPICIKTFLKEALPLIKETLKEDTKNDTINSLKNKRQFKKVGTFLNIYKKSALVDSFVKIAVDLFIQDVIDKNQKETPDITDTNAYKREEEKYLDDLSNDKILPDIDKLSPEESMDVILQYVGHYIKPEEQPNAGEIDSNKREEMERELYRILDKVYGHKKEKTNTHDKDEPIK